LDKLVEYHKNHQQNVDILTKGTLQERRDVLDSTQRIETPLYIGYRHDFIDYRYIRYIFPYMTSQDSIINYGYIAYDGIDENGNLCCGVHINMRKMVYTLNIYMIISIIYCRLISPIRQPTALVGINGTIVFFW